MGVHPYTSTLALVATHRPLQQHIETTLARAVEFYTAASFEAFVRALLAGEYDIVIAPPHFGVLAMEWQQYLPLAHYKARLEPFLVVREDSPYRQAADFSGKRIAMADKTALIRLAMLKMLADAGLAAGRHFQVVERPTHGAAIMATLQGDADAGVAMRTVFKLQPAEVQRQLRVVLAGQSLPNLFTLAHPRLGASLVSRIGLTLREFANLPAGRAFFDQTGYGGYEVLDKDEIVALAPYVEMVRPLVAKYLL
jgi:phosphonate transport system substrate-binding protein